MKQSIFTTAKNRCKWAQDDLLMQNYHDHEWGVPLHDDQKLFEFLILEGAQAGLSWSTILKKRDHYRKVFDDFDPHQIRKYSESKITELMKDPGIVRNKLKIASVIQNAKAFLEIQKEYGSFDAFIWEYTDAKTMSKDLKKRGMNFVGPTICYAFMQAIGIVNDHEATCDFRHPSQPCVDPHHALVQKSTSK